MHRWTLAAGVAAGVAGGGGTALAANFVEPRVRQPERRARHSHDRQGKADPDDFVHAAAQS